MILITGGAGYIGSHAVIELLAQREELLILDNLSNSRISVLDRIEAITGIRPQFVQADIRDKDALAEIFANQRIESVIHFAGLKAVGESVANPLTYYANNVTGTLNLLQVMAEFKVKRLVFSSSATVYGDPDVVPIREDSPLRVSSPYARTKLVIEEILRDLGTSDPSWSVAILRYFNPVGAHASGLIGESPSGTPNNLMPFIAQVASGTRPELLVFGSDYPTRDGTGIRDYLHVADLVSGHIAALNAIRRTAGTVTVNLGTGQGCSVLEMVEAFEKASGKPVPYRFVERRPGDVAAYYADTRLAEALLGWRAERGIHDMCLDTWRWQEKNPNGLD